MLKVIGCITDQHDLRLVVVAALICVLGSFTTFNLNARAGAGVRGARLAWTFAAGFVAGAGVWATHFVAELAFRPGLPLTYDLFFSVLSLAISVVVSTIGIALAVGEGRNNAPLGGAVVGVGIAAMHYTGIAAMRMPAVTDWHADYVAASIVISVAVSSLAFAHFRRHRDTKGQLQATGLLVLAIIGLHFTGMTAITFTPDSRIVIPDQAISPEWLAIPVAAFTLLIVGFGFVGASIDQRLAERTRGEAERLRGHVAELEATKAELNDALKKAEIAGKAKSAFLATMSHEFRTPLNGVIGMTGALIDSNLRPEQQKLANVLRDSAEHLLSLINNVLDYSKLEASSAEFERVPFDLHAVLTHCCEVVTPAAKAKVLDLSVEIAEAVPRHVLSNAGAIRQVVLNLLGNAVKFTERGGVTLRVHARPMARNHITIRIEVVDTGVGIPGKSLGRLFQSFSQADESISRRFGGTGLGLAITKKLVEGLNGIIGVDSVPDRGSTFWLELPVEPVSAEEVACSAKPDRASPVERAKETLAAMGRPLRVLLVEDNATNQLVARTVLGKFGVAPDVAGNGVEAVEAVQRNAYDVVLMDIHMPEMDGLEATRVIRNMSGPVSRTPIVALTANAFDSDIDNCRQAGMDGHVGKPFRAEELIAALGDAVEGKSSFKGRTPSEATPPADVYAVDRPIVDWETIEAFRTDSGEEMLRVLIDTYLVDTAQKLDRFAELVGDKAATAEAVRIAHSLKSASAMAGAVALSRLAAQVEQTLAQGTAEIGTSEAKLMQTHFENYRAELIGRGLAA